MGKAIDVFYVTAVHREAQLDWERTEAMRPSEQRPPQRHELAKFFVPSDADEWVRKLDPSWAKVQVEKRVEDIDDQHAAHGGKLGRY